MTLNQFITAAVNDGYAVTKFEGRVEFERIDERGERFAYIIRNSNNDRVLVMRFRDRSMFGEVINSYAMAGRILRIEGAGFYGSGDWLTFEERKREEQS